MDCLRSVLIYSIIDVVVQGQSESSYKRTMIADESNIFQPSYSNRSNESGDVSQLKVVVPNRRKSKLTGANHDKN